MKSVSNQTVIFHLFLEKFHSINGFPIPHSLVQDSIQGVLFSMRNDHVWKPITFHVTNKAPMFICCVLEWERMAWMFVLVNGVQRTMGHCTMVHAGTGSTSFQSTKQAHTHALTQTSNQSHLWSAKWRRVQLLSQNYIGFACVCACVHVCLLAWDRKRTLVSSRAITRICN